MQTPEEIKADVLWQLYWLLRIRPGAPLCGIILETVWVVGGGVNPPPHQLPVELNSIGGEGAGSFTSLTPATDESSTLEKL